MYVCRCVCRYVCMYVGVCVCMCVCLCVCVYVCVCVCINVCLCFALINIVSKEQHFFISLIIERANEKIPLFKTFLKL
jgi:hypothetical protein